MEAATSTDQILPVNTRISRMSSSSPRPPLGKYPQLRLWPQVGSAPITNSTRMMIRKAFAHARPRAARTAAARSQVFGAALFLLSYRVGLRQCVPDLDVVPLAFQIEAGRMFEPVQFVLRVDDVVGVAVRVRPGRHVVQIECMPQLPGNDVVGAGGVTAHAQPSQQPVVSRVQGKPATKDVDATNQAADHGIVRGAVGGDRAGVRSPGIYRIAFLQSEETSARLYRGIQVGRTQCEARETEGIRGVGLLSRYYPAARPLIPPLLTAEDDIHDPPPAVENGGPHLEAQPAILLLQNLAELTAERVVV